ncbi:MAG: hypothetical protein QNI91_10575 [Arenicellales bacterium]|nr:hypothetical protein [Arenicellales bacterium]
MNQHENQTDHVHDDAELSSYYHAIQKEEPPVAIDKAIIKSARDSVKKERKRLVSPFSGWSVPLATAASVILVVGLIRLLPEDPLYQLPAQPKSPEMVEEENAVSTMTGKRSESAQKAERARLQDELAPMSAPPNQAVTDIASDPKPADQQPTKELRAKVKATVIMREDADKQVPPVSAEEPLGRGVVPQTAQQWIEHISELIGRDKIEQAKFALEEFEKRYPDHPGITDLRTRLEP